LRRILLIVLTGVFLFSATRCDAQILHKKKKVNKSTAAENTAEPDKILYDKAMDDIKHGRQEVGRLNLQTLINTYPDSEYLAKAKLGIADSYYKEGGTANMTQAVQSYKDFIIFFPFMPEAAYAQLQVAMTHFKQLEKPDRDRTQALAAEDEFQTFLQKYPNDPLASKAEQHLREVQEVLAEGDYRIGYYYYVKGDKKAAESRLRIMVNRYPLYSKADQALWMLGNIWDSTEKKEFASNYYARIVRDYPLSPLAPDAKSRLKALGTPVPQPDPKAVAWMTAEQNTPRQHTSLVKKPMSLIHNGPGQELQVAARQGTPTMSPEAENDTGTEVLSLSGARPTGKGGTATGIVATVPVGSSGGSSGGAENVAPATEESAPNGGAQADANTGAAAAGSSAAGATSDAAKSGDAPAAAGTADSATKPDAATGAAQPADAAKTDAAPAKDGTQTAAASDDQKESTSKKKKGLRKLIPW
jgi:outer membrane protein assembly factor BamD